MNVYHVEQWVCKSIIAITEGNKQQIQMNDIYMYLFIVVYWEH